MISVVPDVRPGPLSGLVVADLSRILAGPLCTMLLADMGATVIKVENKHGDDTRRFAPPVSDGVATYYQSINRNKRAVVLDFADSGDLEQVREIIARADIVVENFKAGGLARFGLDYETLSSRQPELIYASITGFGAGDGARYAGYDLMVQALSGFMDTTGPEHGDAYRAGFALFDVITGLHMVGGILAALHHRDATGQGQKVETDLMSAALMSMVNQTQAYVGTGIAPRRVGNEHPSIYPYEPFRTASHDLVIAVGNDGQFARLCATLGREDLAVDERYDTPSQRNQNREMLRAELTDALLHRTAEDWFELLTEVGVPCAPIQSVAEGVRFAERIGLRPVVDVRGVPMLRNPLTFSATPVDYPLAPPALGQHNDEILQRVSSEKERP